MYTIYTLLSTAITLFLVMAVYSGNLHNIVELLSKFLYIFICNGG